MAPLVNFQQPCRANTTFLQHHPARTVPAMRRPDRYELEFTMLMFIVLAPLGFWVVSTLFALVSD